MGGLQVGVDVLRRQDLYVQFPGLGHNTVLAGVSLDQPLLHSPVQGTVEHQMDAAHSGGAQALVLVLSDVYSATLQQLLVELLQVPGGQLLQFDAADAGDSVVLNDQLVAVGYGETLIQQYGGELTDYGLLTRADGQPVQKPLPPQPGLNGMGMRCP